MSGIVAVEVAFVGFGSIYFLKAKDDIEYRRKLYNEGSLWLHCKLFLIIYFDLFFINILNKFSIYY